MSKFIYEDDIFTLEKSGKYLESKIKNYPKKLNHFNQSFYNSDIDEFNLFKERFFGVYSILTGLTDEAWFISCKHIQYLNSISCPLDVRHKLTNEDAAKVLFEKYNKDKKGAVEKIEELISRRDDLNLREEELLNETIKSFNLEDKYKEHLGYKVHDKLFNGLINSTNNLLAELKKINQENQ